MSKKPARPSTTPTPAAATRARQIWRALSTHYPHAHCELVHSTPHELLVATILSAQATDASVNKATPALFSAFKSPAEFARATPQQIEPYIKSIGLFRNKARHIHAAMTAIVERYGGQVPASMEHLLTLPGVARKTAGVILSNAFGINANVVVDTHVHRLAKRLALVPPNANVQQTERALMATFPQAAWCDLSHRLIFHGRGPCKARGVTCGSHPICARFGTQCELRITSPAARRKPPAPSPAKPKRPRKESNL